MNPVSTSMLGSALAVAMMVNPLTPMADQLHTVQHHVNSRHDSFCIAPFGAMIWQSDSAHLECIVDAIS